MNLIILTESDRQGDGFVLRDNRAEHIRNILKSEVGDRLELGLLNGPKGKALVESIDETGIRLGEVKFESVSEPLPTIDLICALPRPQTLKKVLSISATMAVRRVHLIRANRVEKSYFDSPLLQPERYRPFLIEGLSQGKHTRLPEVTIHDRFKKFFEDTLPSLESEESVSAPRLLCHHEIERPITDLVDGQTGRLMVAIGPEGGWVPFETDLMMAAGFIPFSLGRWILRVESAVTAALSQIELLTHFKTDKAPVDVRELTIIKHDGDIE